MFSVFITLGELEPAYAVYHKHHTVNLLCVVALNVCVCILACVVHVNVHVEL